MDTKARHKRFTLIVIALVSLVSQGLQADGRFERAHLLVGTTQVEGVLVSDPKGKTLTFETAGSIPMRVEFAAIKALRYERTARPNYAAGLLIAWPLLFTKTKQHYLTIQYADPTGDGKFQIVRLDKANVRGALDTLEADSGIRVDRTEER